MAGSKETFRSPKDDERGDNREGLFTLREVHINALHRFFDEIHDSQRFKALTDSQLRVRKSRLQQHFSDMQEAHVSYRQVCILASDDIYEELEEGFMDVMAIIEDRLKELSSIELGSFLPAFPAETARPPQIGIFNGNPADWPAFRDLFLEEVHSKDFEPITKLLYLQAACVEKAAEKLGSWKLTSDNYQPAWEVMISSYNDRYHVIHGRLEDFFAVQQQEKESYASLNTVLHALKNTRRELQAICKKPVDLSDQLWIHVAKQRLPKQTLESWEQHRKRTSPNALPTCGEFQHFLGRKAKGCREFEHETDLVNQRTKSSKFRNESSNNRFKPYEKDGRRDKSHDMKPSLRDDQDRANEPSRKNEQRHGSDPSRASGQGWSDAAAPQLSRAYVSSKQETFSAPVMGRAYPPIQLTPPVALCRRDPSIIGKSELFVHPPQPASICPICPGAQHKLFRCPRMLRADLQERWFRALRAGVCLNCLMRGHSSFTCYNGEACIKCKCRHNSILCPKNPIYQGQS